MNEQNNQNNNNLGDTINEAVNQFSNLLNSFSSQLSNMANSVVNSTMNQVDKTRETDNQHQQEVKGQKAKAEAERRFKIFAPCLFLKFRGG